MKQIIRAVVFTVITAYLMSAGCYTNGLPKGDDDGCRFTAIVYINYIGKDGKPAVFGDEDNPGKYNLSYCKSWIDLTTNEELKNHDPHLGNYEGYFGRYDDTVIVAAPARDGKIHSNVKGKLITSVERPRDDENYSYAVRQTNDIEVELFYESPDEAYIVRIVVDSIERWNRNDYKAGEVPKRIVIDVPFDIANLE